MDRGLLKTMVAQRARRKKGKTLDPAVILAAFSEDQATRLTGISKTQLRYWDRTNFFSPSVTDKTQRSAISRVYSFRDLVCLKVLNAIRNESEVPLGHLRSVKNKLAHLGDDMWSKTKLYVLNKRVIFDNPETTSREEVVSGQTILEIPLEVVQGKMQDAVKALWTRDKTKFGAVEKLRTVAHNQPVMAGTRIPVAAIRNFHEAGYSADQIIEEYPDLTREDVRAALAFKSEKSAA